MVVVVEVVEVVVVVVMVVVVVVNVLTVNYLLQYWVRFGCIRTCYFRNCNGKVQPFLIANDSFQRNGNPDFFLRCGIVVSILFTQHLKMGPVVQPVFRTGQPGAEDVLKYPAITFPSTYAFIHSYSKYRE